jgi:hypothetical protein
MPQPATAGTTEGTQPPQAATFTPHPGSDYVERLVTQLRADVARWRRRAFLAELRLGEAGAEMERLRGDCRQLRAQLAHALGGQP